MVVWLLVAAACAAYGGPLPNAFYAMDTCTRASGVGPDAQLEMLQQLGYRGIAWTVGDPAELRALIDSAHRRKMKIFAHYAAAVLKRDRLEIDPRLYADMDALKGQDTLIWVHIGSTDYAKSSDAGDAAAVQGLRELADFAAKRRLRVAIYPHVGDWTERVQDALRVARKVARPNLGVDFNLCHCLYVGDEARIEKLLADARPFLYMVTINGADAGAAGTGWDRLIQTLDRGSYDLKPLLHKLRAIGYRGPIGLQGFGLRGDRRENLARSMQAWRGLMDGL
jgi:sugar phosphate isomerase/epimerase